MVSCSNKYLCMFKIQHGYDVAYALGKTLHCKIHKHIQYTFWTSNAYISWRWFNICKVAALLETNIE